MTAPAPDLAARCDCCGGRSIMLKAIMSGRIRLWWCAPCRLRGVADAIRGQLALPLTVGRC